MLLLLLNAFHFIQKHSLLTHTHTHIHGWRVYGMNFTHTLIFSVFIYWCNTWLLFFYFFSWKERLVLILCIVQFALFINCAFWYRFSYEYEIWFAFFFFFHFGFYWMKSNHTGWFLLALSADCGFLLLSSFSFFYAACRKRNRFDEKRFYYVTREIEREREKQEKKKMENRNPHCRKSRSIHTTPLCVLSLKCEFEARVQWACHLYLYECIWECNICWTWLTLHSIRWYFFFFSLVFHSISIFILRPIISI